MPEPTDLKERLQHGWLRVRRLPLSTDFTYPRPYPRHWHCRHEHAVWNADRGWTYFFPSSESHLCRDYDALMLSGLVLRKRQKFNYA